MHTDVGHICSAEILRMVFRMLAWFVENVQGSVTGSLLLALSDRRDDRVSPLRVFTLQGFLLCFFSLIPASPMKATSTAVSGFHFVS